VGYEIFITLWGVKDAIVSYYAPTRDDARTIAWESFKDLLRDITIDTNETLLEIKTKNKHGTTSLLRLSGWEAVKNRDKGRGVENDLVVLDEAAFFPMFNEKFATVIEPTLLTSKGRLIITSTPNGFNHFYTLAEKAQKSDEWFYSHATSYDNPHNDPAELERLRTQKTADAFAQEYLADFRKLEGLVYKNFDRNVHLYNDLTPRRSTVMVYVGVDFGWTNPTAMIKVEQDTDAHFWVSLEWYKREADMHTIVEAARMLNGNAYYPDPAEPDRINELMRAGLNCHDVSKDVDAGIATVQGVIKQNRLHVHENCLQLIYEFETYRYESARPDKNLPEKPVKENDHGLDALRYVIHMVAYDIHTEERNPLSIYAV
jgi:phage terminase large subunit